MLAAAALTAWGCGAGEELTPLEGWGSDLEAAREEARRTGRQLAVLYSAPWSDVARKFEKQVLTDPAVAGQLERFVLVRLDIDQHREMAEKEHRVVGVPALALSNPRGEKLVLDKGAYPAPELARVLGELQDWKVLDGWETDPAEAEKKVAESGKPLLTLYSAAWSKEAREFEQELPKALEFLKARYTLLRLNLAEHSERAGDAVKAAPALVLPAADGGKPVVLRGSCSAELLTGFIEALGAYRLIEGWSSDYAGSARRAGNEGRPIAVLLDSADHWTSHKFVNGTLASPEISAVLEGFVKVRCEYARKDEIADPKSPWEPGASPCLLLLSKDRAQQARLGPDNDDLLYRLLAVFKESQKVETD